MSIGEWTVFLPLIYFALFSSPLWISLLAISGVGEKKEGGK